MRIFSILAILALAAAPAAAGGQAPPSAVGADRAGAEPIATQPVEGAPEAAAQDRPFTAVPLGNVQPRTLRSYWHLFIAYAVTWVLVFGYALSIGRRFGKLESEVRELRARETIAP